MCVVGLSLFGCVGHAVGAVVWAYRGVREATEPCGVNDSGDTIGHTTVPVQPTSIAAAASAAAASATAAASNIAAGALGCFLPDDAIDSLD